jgi:hypothetical protein
MPLQRPNSYLSASLFLLDVFELGIYPFISINVYIHLLTYLLTELSSSREVANCAATQKLPSILWKPKVQNCVHHRALHYIEPDRSSPHHLIVSLLDLF